MRLYFVLTYISSVCSVLLAPQPAYYPRAVLLSKASGAAIAVVETPDGNGKEYFICDVDLQSRSPHVFPFILSYILSNWYLYTRCIQELRAWLSGIGALRVEHGSFAMPRRCVTMTLHR
jgi:hypothetical protein